MLINLSVSVFNYIQLRRAAALSKSSQDLFPYIAYDERPFVDLSAAPTAAVDLLDCPHCLIANALTGIWLMAQWSELPCGLASWRLK
jgi:hypothetical protein